MSNKKIELYTINRNVKCVKCGYKGAIKRYGSYYPNGLGKEEVDKLNPITKKIMSTHINNPYMSHSLGFGGTIPHECLNCGNTGLVGLEGLEGYTKAFETVESEDVNND